MEQLIKYRIVCTLSFGDIYGQIMVWLIVIFLSLASALALWSAERQIYALATVGLILVLSLPFLLFAFVTTLLNHIELDPIEVDAKNYTRRQQSTQKPAEASSWYQLLIVKRKLPEVPCLVWGAFFSIQLQTLAIELNKGFKPLVKLGNHLFNSPSATTVLVLLK